MYASPSWCPPSELWPLPSSGVFELLFRGTLAVLQALLVMVLMLLALQKLLVRSAVPTAAGANLHLQPTRRWCQSIEQRPQGYTRWLW
jgi:hypothetical protein